MSGPTSVKVSQRFQIILPAVVRQRLNLQCGDHLLVDIQEGMIILLPQPENYTQNLAGFYHEIWEGIDAQKYIDEERGDWDNGIQMC
jgi:AbrB family looped-hinge helix DNA binding protein